MLFEAYFLVNNSEYLDIGKTNYLEYTEDLQSRANES